MKRKTARKTTPEQLRKINRIVNRQNGVPGETRTLDPLLRRQLLYPPELQGHLLTNSSTVIRALQAVSRVDTLIDLGMTVAASR